MITLVKVNKDGVYKSKPGFLLIQFQFMKLQNAFINEV